MAEVGQPQGDVGGGAAGVLGPATLGVDEHVWHHVSPLKRGPKELTGMVDLTRHPDPKKPGKLVVRARLLDLVPDGPGRCTRPG